MGDFSLQTCQTGLISVTNAISGGSHGEERDKEMLHRPDRGGGQEGEKALKKGKKTPKKCYLCKRPEGGMSVVLTPDQKEPFFYAKIALVPVERKGTKDWVFDYFLCWECAVLVGLRPKGPLLREKNRPDKGAEIPWTPASGSGPGFLLVRRGGSSDYSRNI